MRSDSEKVSQEARRVIAASGMPQGESWVLGAWTRNVCEIWAGAMSYDGDRGTDRWW